MTCYRQQLQFGSEISKLVYRVVALFFRDLYSLSRHELQLTFIRQFLQGLDFLSEFGLLPLGRIQVAIRVYFLSEFGHFGFEESNVKDGRYLLSRP